MFLGYPQLLLQNRCFLYHIIGRGTGEWRVPKGGMGKLVNELIRVCSETGNVTFANSGTSSIIVMIVLQSFVIGILATIFFNYAVKILGAAETGAFGALTPILALVGGIFLLDEPFEPFKIFGVTLVAFGVLLASGLLDKPKL